MRFISFYFFELFLLLTLNNNLIGQSDQYLLSLDNQQIIDNQFCVDVSIAFNQAGKLGSSNLVLEFNQEQLAKPYFVNDELPDANYLISSFTNPVDSLASFNIELLTENDGLAISAAPSKTKIGRVCFDHLEGADPIDVEWVVNSTNNTVVYLDDESSILQNGSLEEFCMNNEPCDDGDPFTAEDAYNENCDCVGDHSVVFGKILLEGFLNKDSGLMESNLKELNLLPLTQPFNKAPWFYNGTEQVTSIPEGVIDWILIMTRDDSDNILNQSAGFVNEEGEFLNIDGSRGISIKEIEGSYISIHHQSHLPIISANPYTIGTFYDFTIASTQALGLEQQKSIGNKFVLYAGDYDANGLINNLDYNHWKKQSAKLNEYLSIDGDGNGIINATDYNLWTQNRSKIGMLLIP